MKWQRLFTKRYWHFWIELSMIVNFIALPFHDDNMDLTKKKICFSKINSTVIVTTVIVSQPTINILNPFRPVHF